MTCVGTPTWPVAALPHSSFPLRYRNGPIHATSAAVSVSPNHSHKICRLTNGRLDGAQTKSWPLKARHSTGPVVHFSQMGRSSPQAWIRTRPNSVSHPRQPRGACLVTRPGLWVTSLMAPLTTPRWPTPAYQQQSVLIRRKQPRVSKLRPPNPQNPIWWSPSKAPHVNLLPPHRGSSLVGCPEDRYSVCGRIWQNALGGRRGVKPRASPAGMRTECAAGSLNWSIFSTSTVSIFVS